MKLRFGCRFRGNGDFLWSVQVAECQIVEAGIGKKSRRHAVDAADGDVAFRIGGRGTGYEGVRHKHSVQFGVCLASGGQIGGDEL